MAFNAYADVTFNTVVTNDYPTEAGIWVQDFLNTGTPHTMNITDNDVTVGQDNFGGIWVNLAYLRRAQHQHQHRPFVPNRCHRGRLYLWHLCYFAATGHDRHTEREHRRRFRRSV